MTMRRPQRTTLPTWQAGQGVGGNSEQVSYEITRLCGHTEVIRIWGNPETSRYVASQRDKDCRQCYTAKMVDSDQASVDAGKRVALDGGPKQVPWAQTVRQSRSADMRTYLAEITSTGMTRVTAGKLDRAEYEVAIADVRSAFSDLMLGVEFSEDDYDHSAFAKWWIDGRKEPTVTIIAQLLPDRDILGTGVFTRLSPDGWSRSEEALPFVLMPKIEDVDDAPLLNRTATPLPGTAPEPFNPHAPRGKGRLPVKAVAATATGTWRTDVIEDLDESPF